MKPKTLAWWRWNLRAEEGATRAKAKARPKPRLLPVVVSSAAVSQPDIEVAIRDGVTMRISAGADVGYVAALVAAVRATC